MAASRHIVAKVGEIADNAAKLVTVDRRAIAIFHVDGAFFAINNRCPHEGGSLCHGKLVGMLRSSEPGKYEYSGPNKLLQCPWHGWEFDIRTGQSWCHPGKVFTKSYPVEVLSGQELVQGPYVAETFPVTVEGEFVVVTV